MHRLTSRGSLALLLLVFLSAGCELFNAPEDIPAYVSFQHPMVSTVGDTTFRSNAGIRNIWLYHAGFLQGAYQIDPELDTLGRVVPILDLERTDFFMEPGVYESGQSSFQIPYPFWDRVTFDWQATAGDTLFLTPVFHYVDASLYDLPVSATFEVGGVDFAPFSSGLTGDSTFFRIRNDDVYRGSASGIVLFSQGHRFFETISSTPFRTIQSRNIFAEITYKSNIPFTVGLIYGSTNNPNRKPILTVNPSTDWNTVFVHMITEVRAILNQNGPDTDFWLWLQADGGNEDGFIRFDDIRVIRAN